VVGLQGNPNRKHAGIPAGAGRRVAGLQDLRSRNDLYEIIAIVPYILLLGSSVLGISLTEAGQDEVGAAIKIGLFVAALFFLMQFNQWDSYRAG